MSNRWIAIVGLGLVLGASRTASAQGGGLTGRDRSLLYYRALYQGPREQREQQQVQKQFQADLQNFQKSQSVGTAGDDSVDRLLREGRGGAAKSGTGQEKSGKGLPPIYSGNAVNRQYFMRVNYFGSAAQSPVQRPGSSSTRRPSSSSRRYF